LCRFFDDTKTNCRNMPETGGILIGSYRGPHVEVSDRTEAGLSDKRSLTSFLRQDQHHQTAATAAWSASQATKTYVGEWHTHPFGEPHPSMLDQSTWRSVVKRLRAPCVFIIVSPSAWAVFCIADLKPPINPVRLSLVEHGERGLVFE